MVNFFNSFLLIVLVSVLSLQAKGLAEINHLPHAQKLIKDALKARNLDPDKFDFIFINDLAITESAYDPGKDAFFLDLGHLITINEILAEKSSSDPEKIFLQDIGGNVSRKNYLEIFKGTIGHEIQHAVDRNLLLSIKYPTRDLFSDKSLRAFFSRRRQMEDKADIHCSTDHNVLKALAIFFQCLYDYRKNKAGFLGREKDYYDLTKKHMPYSPTPHLLDRARYLKEAARIQALINQRFNKAYNCLSQKISTQESQRNKRINQNVADTLKMCA